MRFSVFLTLFVATFIACTSFTSADNVDDVPSLKGAKTDDIEEERNLWSHFAPKKVVAFGKNDRAIGNAKGAIEVMQSGAKKTREAGKSSVKVYDGFGKLVVLSKRKQRGVEKAVAKAAKQKVPWSKTKKLIVGVAGASIGAAGLYVLYKSFLSNGGTPAAPATV